MAAATVRLTQLMKDVSQKKRNKINIKSEKNMNGRSKRGGERKARRMPRDFKDTFENDDKSKPKAVGPAPPRLASTRPYERNAEDYGSLLSPSDLQDDYDPIDRSGDVSHFKGFLATGRPALAWFCVGIIHEILNGGLPGMKSGSDPINTGGLESHSVFKKIAYVGAAIGALWAGNLCDRYGRRLSLITGSLFLSLGSICIAVAVAGRIWDMSIGSLIVGVGFGVVTTAAPVYITEIAPAERRGIMLVLPLVALFLGLICAHSLSHNFSWPQNDVAVKVMPKSSEPAARRPAWLGGGGPAQILLGNDIGSDKLGSWRILAWFSFAGSLLCAISSVCAPESMPWARNLSAYTLRYYMQIKPVTTDSEIMEKLERAGGNFQEHTYFLQGLMHPPASFAVVVGFILIVIQQAAMWLLLHISTEPSPNPAFLLNITGKYGAKMSTFIEKVPSPAIFAGLQILAGIFVLPLALDSPGRRKHIGLFGCTSMLILSGLWAACYYGKISGYRNWILILCQLAYAISLGPLAIVIIPESFSHVSRAEGCALLATFTWSLVLIVSILQNFMPDSDMALIFVSAPSICGLLLFTWYFEDPTRDMALRQFNKSSSSKDLQA